jgi:hypothetical protein
MTDLNVTTEGDERAVRGLHAVDSPAWLDAELETWINASVDLKQERYPPERPGQRYQRTQRLQYAWEIRKPRQLTRVITNEAKDPKTGEFYSSKVVGQQQGKYFVGRWWKALDIVNQRLPALTSRVGERGVEIYEQAR